MSILCAHHAYVNASAATAARTAARSARNDRVRSAKFRVASDAPQVALSATALSLVSAAYNVTANTSAGGKKIDDSGI
jgi:hypothetical protein